MKSKPTACLAAALCLSLSSLAFAAPGDWQGDRDAHHMRDDRRGPPHEVDMRGAGPEHNWHRGDRLPMEYRGRQYVVDDWRAHHLNAPPRGYEWVQSGPDYVLAAIATGVIASILINQ